MPPSNRSQNQGADQFVTENFLTTVFAFLLIIDKLFLNTNLNHFG